MRTARAWLLRLLGLFGTDRRDRQLAAELDSHLQLHIDDNVRAGMTSSEAQRSARLALGGVEQTKERVRDRRGFPAAEHVAQDLRHAVRVLAKRPLLLAATTVSIGIGVGINVSVYSILHKIFIAGRVTARAPEQFVKVLPGISYPNYQDLPATEALSGLAAMNMAQVVWRGPTLTATISAQVVSENFFDVVGVPAAIGRTFGIQDSVATRATDRVVVTDGFWRQRLGEDPAIVGQTLTLNGWPYTIVGVLPKGFYSLPLVTPSMYVPISDHVANGLPNRRAAQFDLIGRLRNGVTREQATAALRVVAQPLEASFPDENRGFARDLRVIEGEGFASWHEPEMRPMVAAAGAVYLMVGLVLLVACANVAGLLAARADERRHEIAVRIALGATRARLTQQFLAESLVIATLGCAAGATLWILCATLIPRTTMVVNAGINVVPGSLPFLYCLALTFVVTIARGMAPAWTAKQVAPVGGLHARRLGHRDSGVHGVFRRFTLQGALVAAQVAVCFVLLTAAFVVLHIFLRQRIADPGFDIAHTLLVDARLPTTSKGRGFFAVREAIEQVPGVAAVSSGGLPIGLVAFGRARPADSANNIEFRFDLNRVGPRYLDTLGIPLMRGRDLNDDDLRAGSADGTPAIVNETFVGRYLGSVDPIGRRFVIPPDPENGTVARPLRIVGVSRDSEVRGLANDRVPSVYLPGVTGPLVVRVAGPAAGARRTLEQTVSDLQPGSSVVATPMADQLSLVLMPARVGTLLLSVLGAIGLVLAMTGLYGVVSYAASRRTFEIGIRMALGATQPAVVRMILRDGLLLVGVGCVIGAVLSLGVFEALRLLVFAERSSIDAVALVGVLTMLFIVGGAASLWPARRAAAFDPMTALRHE